MHKLISRTSAAAMVGAAASLVLAVAPASAIDLYTAEIVHLPDTGYQAPFTIRCQDHTTNHHLVEGKSSKIYCKDVGRIYVHKNEQIACKDPHGGGFYPKWDTAGWHDVHDSKSAYECVNQRD